MASTLIGKQAVVIGAGMGGLTAAGALADHFEQVVVLERDTLPSEPTHRAGTPQARHVHALLLSGQRALSELFPGFEQDLARAGAVRLQAGLDPRLETPGYDPFPQRDLGWCVYSASRPTIERVVRHGWKASPTSCCASVAGSRKCWRREMERRSPACAARMARARARRSLRILSSTPPDAARPLSPCCNRSADAAQRRPQSASISPIPHASLPSPTTPRPSGKGHHLRPGAPQSPGRHLVSARGQPVDSNPWRPPR